MSIDLDRFDNFKDAQLRLVEVVSPSHIKVTLGVQDKARDFDWISLTLEFTGIVDARLPKENQLEFIDMSDGVSILKDDNKFVFAIGACYNISTIKNSIFYIISTDLKSYESPF
ncbi:hypothetical protein [Sulfurimonas sp.]|uniref:hypothetical protein n=1 Tax=Sulfurimonas sp. TaxID=2022749 RepID=UPI00262BE1E9|nr:hypothetical protein [Sulfurimonas sp.]